MRRYSRAWGGSFHDVAWSEIASRFHRMAADHPHFRHMADIADSVLACGAEHRLAAVTSMHDLVITAAPVPEFRPIEVVVVRSPSSGFAGAGVLIEHRSITGHDDRVLRATDEAVPLFWRFMIEKLGVARH